MQISRFQKALAIIEEHGLDVTDMKILAVVAEQQAAGVQPTIMKLPMLVPNVSFGTINTRIKRMVRNGFLTKTVEETNQRRKIIGYGPRTQGLLDKLSEAF